MYTFSILHSIYSICSSRHTFKSWIWTSEKSCTSCPNWGVGGEVIWTKSKRTAVFFVSPSLISAFTKQIYQNCDSWESLHWKRSCFHSYHLHQWMLLQNFWDIYIVVYVQSKIPFWNKVAFFLHILQGWSLLRRKWRNVQMLPVLPSEEHIGLMLSFQQRNVHENFSEIRAL